MKISNKINNLSLSKNRPNSLEDYVDLIREQNKYLITAYETSLEQLSPEELQGIAEIHPCHLCSRLRYMVKLIS